MTKLGDVSEPSSPPLRRRPVTNARGRAMRDQILQIAKVHFGNNGFRGSSTAAIAAEAGITDPGLLHHFQTKAGLLVELLEERFGRDEERLSVEGREGGTALLDKLAQLITENTANRQDVRLYSVLLGESVADDHPGHEYFAKRFRHARDIIHSSLQSGQERGHIRSSVDTEGLSAALVALMDGLQYQWLIDPTVSMEGSFRAIATLIGDAMVKK